MQLLISQFRRVISRTIALACLSFPRQRLAFAGLELSLCAAAISLERRDLLALAAWVVRNSLWKVDKTPFMEQAAEYLGSALSKILLGPLISETKHINKLASELAVKFTISFANLSREYR